MDLLDLEATVQGYVTVPVPVTAIKYNGQNEKEIIDFANGEIEVKRVLCLDFDESGRPLHIVWIDERHRDSQGPSICIGDWVVRGDKGIFSVHKEEDFKETYELDSLW